MKYLKNIIYPGCRKIYGNHFIDRIAQKYQKLKSLFDNDKYSKNEVLRIDSTLYII